jgi:hypothetical protein
MNEVVVLYCSRTLNLKHVKEEVTVCSISEQAMETMSSDTD